MVWRQTTEEKYILWVVTPDQKLASTDVLVLKSSKMPALFGLMPAAIIRLECELAFAVLTRDVHGERCPELKARARAHAAGEVTWCAAPL